MRILVASFMLLMTVHHSIAQSRINIIPKPAMVQELEGQFALNNNKIYVSAQFREVAVLLSDLMRWKQNRIFLLKKGAVVPAGSIIIEKTKGNQQDSASYALDIKTKSVRISSAGYAGAINAMQSLAQIILTQDNKNQIPCARIQDQPRFGYRGLMIDVSRHFFPPSFIKKMIDLIGLYKINTLHMHLTDAAGWRIEVKKYPALTAQAAWRTSYGWKKWWNSDRDYVNEGEANAYGGYYTQLEAKELVAYAQKRGITIIPEIEMPGHSEEVIAAYPNLGCVGAKKGQGEFCLGNDSTFTFMQDVITEMMDIFPSTYIHIGGDEAGKSNWKSCSKCQQRIKDNNLKDEFELQSYAIRRMEKFISSKGRQLLGWDEILEGGLAPGARVMSWRGEKGGIEAARMGHDVIMTPGGTCYFDKYQQDPSTEPEAIGGFLPLQKVYEYEPMPKELEADKQKHLLGAQANLWTEYVPTMEHAEYMIFPRIIALSEAVWTERKNMEWTDFQYRLSQHYKLLQRLNVNYCRPSDRLEIKPLIDAPAGTTNITLSSEQYKPEIRYTTDGSMPNSNSTLYAGPFSINGSALVKTAIFRKGRMSQAPDTIDINLHKAIGKTITYNKKYSSSYVAQKEATLINGYRGSLTYQDGQWQGFLNDLDVTIDLGKEESLSKLRSTFMQVTGPGVYMPHFVEVSLSKDGSQFTTLEKVLNDVPATDPKLLFKTFEVSLKGQSARYVRFVAKLQRGFLFADEIIID